MTILLISMSTLAFLPVWLMFAYITLRIGSNMDDHSLPDWFAVLAALLMPVTVGAAYIHFDWRFFWLNSLASAVLIALPALLIGAMAKNMFRSLLPERSVPTTVDPTLRAQFVPVKQTPQESDEAISVSRKLAKLMTYQGRPPASTLNDSKPQFAHEKTFAVASYDTSPPIGFFNIKPFEVELWELDSFDDPRPIRKLDFVKTSSKDEPDFWHTSEVEMLPHNRLIVAMRDGHRAKLYVFNRDTLTLVPFSTVNVESSPQFELKNVSERVAIVSYQTHRVRRRAEIYYNYYTHFVLFTNQHPDGLEVLKLGIDVGIVRRWLVSESTLYVQAYDPRRSDEIAAKWWSLDLSVLIGRDSFTDRRGAGHH